MRTKSILERPKDLGAYLAISVLVVTLTIVIGVYNVHLPWFWKWGAGFGTMTAIVFGYFIEASKDRWKYASFWALAAALILVHTVAFWFVFSRLVEWKPFWFCLGVPELMVFSSVKEALAARTRNRN